MVTDIINSLSAEDSLIKSLHQTLIFARRVGNKELANWVLKELNGYGEKLNDTKHILLPAYRYVRHVVVGVMRQNGRLTRETSLPLTCFGRELETGLSQGLFDESLATLEGIVKNSENQYIIKILAADFCSGLTQQAKLNGHNFEVISCRQIVTISQVIGIVTAIKTTLLELLLSIESQYSSVDVLSTNTNTNIQVNKIINNYMGQVYNITTSGNGILVNTGNDCKLMIDNSTKVL
jgi:hypothetical protein